MKIGIDIGGSHVGIGIVNDGKIIEQEEIRILKVDKEKIEEFIEDYLVRKILEFNQKYKIETIGISSAGKINNNIIEESPNLGFKNYNLIEHLKDKTNLKDIEYLIKNDSQCAGIAEKKYGSLKYVENAVFITIGTGIGGAVFINDKLIKSENKAEFEFGHIILKENGIKCNCGQNGCFEKYAGIKAFKDKIRKELELDEQTSGKEIVKIINNNPNNQIIKKVIDEYVENLTDGLVIILNKYDLNTIDIGGGFFYYRHILLKKIKNRLEEKIKRNIDIKIATLGNDAGIIGATIKE